MACPSPTAPSRRTGVAWPVEGPHTSVTGRRVPQGAGAGVGWTLATGGAVAETVLVEVLVLVEVGVLLAVQARLDAAETETTAPAVAQVA